MVVTRKTASWSRMFSNTASTKNLTVKAKHYIPRAQRSASKTMFEIDKFYDGRLVRATRKDPTRELNYSPEHWERHKSVWRRVRHVVNTFRSSPFQRLFLPDLFITASIAGGLTYYNEMIAVDAASQLGMQGMGMVAGTTAIGLLSAFRLNASYGRYNEARKLLSSTIYQNFAGSALMWLESEEKKERMLNLIKAFPVALNFHLNGKGGHHMIRRRQKDFKEQVLAEYHLEMLDIFENEGDTDFVRIFNQFREKENVPLYITTTMRKIISQNGSQESIYNRELEEHVQRLVASASGCDRVLKTPIPTCFTRHTSRLLFIWSNLVPFAVYPVCGPLFTLPASVLVAYSIMGIEDIGVQLEEPFNILPMRQYSDGVYASVNAIKTVYNEDDPGSSTATAEERR